MIFRKLIGLGFVAILFFAFFGAVGSMRQNRTDAAYMQGYLAGQQAAASEDGTINTAPPATAYGYNKHVRGHGGFFPGAGFFLCLLPLLFFGFMFMVGSCKHRWKHGHYGKWHNHKHWKGGPPKPPWVDDDDLTDEPVMKA